MNFRVLALAGSLWVADAASVTPKNTCQHVKDMYQEQECCGNPTKEVDWSLVPKHKSKRLFKDATNPCAGKKPATGAGDAFSNKDCLNATDGSVVAKEQAGANVTKGYQGTMDVGDRVPILSSYLDAGLCPVNVHWHLGAEHLSEGQYDSNGDGPAGSAEEDDEGESSSRRLATARLGHRCHHYDADDARFTTEYNWTHCVGMHVGETYEVHWPHSKMGSCGTPWQYQSPFYDGVFCRFGEVEIVSTESAIGVEGQVFTIINDEDYYYGDLMRGMIVQGDYGADIAKYTGSTTGTSRDNTVCSWFAPITWQVDRKCHLISASSFDKMCADMSHQLDDMAVDLHAHGARETVLDQYVGNNFYRI